MSTSDDELNAEIAALWQRWRGEMMRRVEVVATVVSALRDGDLDEQLRLEGESTAHKINGTAGSFGFPAASRAAHELELAFHDGATSADAPRLAELVEAIRTDFARRDPN